MSALAPARPASARRSPRRDLPEGKLLRSYLHKTSNSLCGIKGYAGLIARRDPARDSIVDWAQKIICEVEKMESIYRSVEDLARPSVPLDGAVDPAQVLVHARDHCCRLFPLLNVTLPCLPPCDGLLPAADLFQVLVEILTNSAEGRTGVERPVAVHLSWQAAGDRLALRVVDDGPGLDPVISRQAMDPFVTTKPGHAGIGLTRVETILDLHGLDWTLHSDAGAGVGLVLQIAELRKEPLEQEYREEGA